MGSLPISSCIGASGGGLFARGYDIFSRSAQSESTGFLGARH